MNRGIANLSAYQEGGPILAALRRLLEPDTAGGHAAVMGASLTPVLSTAVDAGDMLLGVKDRDPLRIGLASLGFLIPGVSGGALRRALTGRRGGRGVQEDLLPGLGDREGGIADLQRQALLDDRTNYIVGPALRISKDPSKPYEYGKYFRGDEMIFTAPGARTHSEVLNHWKHREKELFGPLRKMTDDHAVPHSEIFGFVDAEGRFLTPKNAAALAYDAGQLSTPDLILRRSMRPEPYLHRGESSYRNIPGLGDRWFDDLWSEDVMDRFGKRYRR